MSKYLRVQTQFKDEAMFKEALEAVCEEMRVAYDHYEDPRHLIGFQGGRRQEAAHYIIGRGYIGLSSNDLGFRREDGQIVAVISEFDSKPGRKARRIVNATKREYAKRKVTQIARRRGMDVEEIHDNGVVRLRLVPKRSRRSQRRVKVRR